MASNLQVLREQIRRGCAFLALTVCLQGLSPVMAAPSVAPVAGSTSGAGVPINTPWVTLRNAAREKKITVKLIGDGATTTKIRMSLTNNGGNPVVVFIPANEILIPGTLGVQKMMVLKNSAIKLAGGETRAFDLGTMCVSVKTVPPPGADPAEFTVDAYGDDKTWGQIAAVVAAAAELDRKGAFKDLHLNADNRRGQITQLAIWRLLGQQSGNPEDSVTPETIEQDFWRAVGDRGKSDPSAVSKIPGVSLGGDGKLVVADAQRKNIHDTYVQPIFDAIDLTVRTSADPKLKNVAPLPTNSAFETYLAAGERSYENGDFVEASEVLGAAVTEAENFGEGDPRLSHSLVSKGVCLLDFGAYDAARTDLSRAKELREKVSGKQSVPVAEVDNDLGVLNQRLEQYPVAENWFTQALGIIDAAAQKNTPLLGSTLDNLGRNFNLQAQGDKAEPLLKRALAVAILNNEGAKSLGGNPDVAEIETNLATAYTLMGNYADAGKLFEKALAQDTAALGAEHPFIANILDGYAANLDKQNQPQAAEPYKKKAADIRSKAFGTDQKLVQVVANLPLTYDALTRIQLYSNGAKEVSSTMDKFMLEGENIKAPSIDKLRINGPIGDKWAVVIGISDFADKSINLKYAAKDAQDFATYLEKEANFAPDHVHLLLNSQATRKNVLDQIADSFLPRVALKEDLVLIYLSSHGSPSKADVAGMNYLVAYDTNKDSLFSTGIAMDELTAMIKKRIPAQRVIVVLDACHSGAVSAKGLFNVANFDADTVAAGSGQLVICSSKPNEVSWESKEHPNGVFTYHLLEALRKKPKLGDAYAEMEKNVRAEVQMDRHGEQQDPQLKSSWVGDDIILTVAPKDPRRGLPMALETATTAVRPNLSPSKSVGGVPTKPAVRATTNCTTVKKTTAK